MLKLGALESKLLLYVNFGTNIQKLLTRQVILNTLLYIVLGQTRLEH